LSKGNTHHYSNTFYKYFNEIRTLYLKEGFTEMTFRTPFETLIRQINPEFSLLQEPSRERKIGAPDFKAYKNAAKIGFIETKNLDKNLDQELQTEQIKKYKQYHFNKL
jgi:hypothetical protein